jgi:hypothetical protein
MQAPLLDISLNIYNYMQANCLLEQLGIGLYHTGIEIKYVCDRHSNIEYQFICCSENPHETGVCSIRPGTGGFPFNRKVPLAILPVPRERFDQIFRQLEAKYTVGRYNLFGNNCNHFVADFVLQLTGIVLPNYLFRMTNFLGLFSCCLPDNYLNGQWALAEYNKDLR